MNKPNAPREGNELPALTATGQHDEEEAGRIYANSIKAEDLRYQLMRERRDRLIRERQLKAALSSPQQEWISVDQKLPPTGLSCWVVWNGYVQRVAYKRIGHGYACVKGYSWVSAIEVGEDVMKDEEVTHWQPLPAPPVTADGKPMTKLGEEVNNLTPIMKYFDFAHLPDDLKCVSGDVYALACSMDAQLPDGPEKSAGLRKLLEAKDCFVRAKL